MPRSKVCSVVGCPWTTKVSVMIDLDKFWGKELVTSLKAQAFFFGFLGTTPAFSRGFLCWCNIIFASRGCAANGRRWPSFTVSFWFTPLSLSISRWQFLWLASFAMENSRWNPVEVQEVVKLGFWVKHLTSAKGNELQFTQKSRSFLMIFWKKQR